jgi:chromosome segregation ATPase
MLTKQAADQEARQEQRVRADRLEGETMARLVRQLQERVESLGTFDSSVALLRDEDGRLQAELSRVVTQIGDIVKRLGAQDQRLGLLSQEGQTLREGLASTKLSQEALQEQSTSLKVAIESVAPPLDAKMEQLQLSLIDLSKGRQADLDAFQARLQDQARQIDGLGEKLTAVQVPLERWGKQMEELMGQYERNRKTLYDLHELERAIRQQGKELSELQRLAAERQRAELREWQDNQSRVDEEQTARIERTEDWQDKTEKTLTGLEQSLEEVRRDIASRADQLWQVWSEFVRQQSKLFGDFKQRRAG